MATETLRIDITAENAQAIASLNKVNQQLVLFEKALAKSTNPKELIYLQRNVDFLKEKVSALATVSKGALVQGTNSAANSLQNLGRIAQDAPFGFIGIQNNLNPLLESFQRLKAESGSTGGALKAMAGSLMGAGGIGLALSVASSLFLVFGKNMFTAAKGAEALKTAMDSEVESASKTISQMQALISVSKNANLSIEQRGIAVDQLVEKYPAYFKGLTKENSLTFDLTANTKLLTNAILQRAAARAMEADVADRALKIFQEQNKIAQMDVEIAKLKKDKTNISGFGNSLTAELSFSQQLAAAERDRAASVTKIANLTVVMEAFQKRINAIAASTVNLDEKKAKTEKEVTKEYEKQYDIQLKGQVIKQNNNNRAFGTIANKEGDAPTSVVGGDNSIMGLIAQARAMNTVVQATKLYNQDMEQAMMITNAASQAFTDLSYALLQGQDLGEALGNVFKKLAADIAAAAIKAMIFKIILGIITGGSSGVADLAGGGASFGKLFGGFLGLGKGFAEGGISTGKKSGHMELLHGTEAIFPMDKLRSYTDRAINVGRGMGSQNNQIAIGEFTLRGQDLQLALTRSNTALNYRRGG